MTGAKHITLGGNLKTATLVSPEQLLGLRESVDLLTTPALRKGGYIAGFACSPRALEAAQRLRYEVFNVELGEGLPASHLTGLDQDPFDHQMTHLVLFEEKTGLAVGTYRLQTMRHALQSPAGIYSAQEYDLAALSDKMDLSVECGRACIAQGHRTFTTVLLLWMGIGVFMKSFAQRYVFGCCSLTTTNPDDGWRAMQTIRKNGNLHPDVLLPAIPPYSCGDPAREFDPSIGKALPLPKLFSAYLRLGCKVVSEPALDLDFKTVDFLIFLDSMEVNLSSLIIHEG